jgi:hypothetical protein
LTEFQTAVETATVVLTSASQLSIGDQGLFGPDVGNILFSVQVSTSVPEVSTWGMMLLGFAGLGFAGYRRTKNVAFAA